MKRLVTLLTVTVVLATLLLSTACAPSSTLSLTYESAAYGVRIKYPQDWIQGGGSMGAFVVFYPPKSSGSFPFLEENLSISFEDLSAQPMTLDAYVQLSINEPRQSVTDFNLIDSSPTTLAGIPAHKVVFTGKHDQDSLEWLQVYTIIGNRAYTITCIAKQATYADFLGIVEQMIDSLHQLAGAGVP